MSSDDVWFGFAMCLFIVAAFTGIFSLGSDEAVTPEQINIAESMCESNGGLNYLEVDWTGIDVICNNTARFWIKESGTKSLY